MEVLIFHENAQVLLNTHGRQYDASRLVVDPAGKLSCVSFEA